MKGIHIVVSSPLYKHLHFTKLPARVWTTINTTRFQLRNQNPTDLSREHNKYTEGEHLRNCIVGLHTHHCYNGYETQLFQFIYGIQEKGEFCFM